MRPNQQFTVQDNDRASYEQKKAEQQFRPVLVSADEEKTDEQGVQEIQEAAQGDQAVIIRPLKDLVNDGLKQPVVIVPGLGWSDVGKESVMGDGSVLPEIPPAGEVIPKVGVDHHDGPSDKIADQDQEEKEDQGYGIKSEASYAIKEPAVYGFGSHAYSFPGDLHTILLNYIGSDRKSK